MRRISCSVAAFGMPSENTRTTVGSCPRIAVAAHDVVIQNGFELPGLLFGHLGKVLAAVQPLLFTRNSQEDDGGGKPDSIGKGLAQNAGTFQADGGAAAIVVRAGSGIGAIEVIAVAGVVVAGDEHDATGLRGVRATQNRINIGDFGGILDAFAGLLGEGVGLDLQAAAAIFGIALELGLDPLAGRANALACFDGFFVLRGKGGSIAETYQLIDGLLYAVR